MPTQDRIVPDGRFHSFHVEGDKPGEKHGWYILHLDPYPVGTFADWRLRKPHTWKEPFPKGLSGEERAALERRCAEARAKEQAEIERREAKARREAEYIWNHADPAPENHPYLQKKKIKVNGARLYRRCLVLPVRDVEGNLHSLQLISPTGEKRFLRGGRVVGCSCPLGHLQERIYITEGFATGATVYQVTGKAVAIAFHAGNLKPVAEALRKEYPKTELVIAADNDAWTDGNPGLSKAREAAKAVKGKVAVPRFQDTSTHPTDFNDLFRLEGGETVTRQLERTWHPEALGRPPGVLASEVKPEPVRWFWDKWIALGELSILEGDPGLMKSTMAIDLTARLTRGLPLPDGSPAQIPSSGVVLITTEDNFAHTVRPRLGVAGADINRVRLVKRVTGPDGTLRPLTLPDDLLEIEKAICDVDARLVVIDPISASLSPSVDAWKDTSLRPVLARLEDLAERSAVAILVLRHLTKGSSTKALYRGQGSIAFSAAARAVLLVAEDQDNPGGHVLAMLKSNLAAPQASLCYCAEVVEGILKVRWKGQSPLTSVNLLDDSQAREERSRTDEAVEFLEGALAAGRVLSIEIISTARKLGISDRTLRRARRQLHVKSYHEGEGKDQRWYLELAEGAKKPSEGANIENLAPSAQNTELTGFRPIILAERANPPIVALSAPALALSAPPSEVPKTPPPATSPASVPTRPQPRRRKKEL
jgi:putative DNA primase/helicase